MRHSQYQTTQAWGKRPTITERTNTNLKRAIGLILARRGGYFHKSEIARALMACSRLSLANATIFVVSALVELQRHGYVVSTIGRGRARTRHCVRKQQETGA